jgi:hypothetical protein
MLAVAMSVGSCEIVVWVENLGWSRRKLGGAEWLEEKVPEKAARLLAASECHDVKGWDSSA